MEIKVANWDDFNVGDKAEHTKIIQEEDIQAFAKLSGDYNPLHVNAEYAKSTIFKQRIAHGMISASLISAVLGMHLPGPGAVYMSQEVKFRKPVFIGDKLTAKGEVVEKFTKKDGQLKFLKIQTNVYKQDDELVTEGYALVIIQ
ncbi:MAG: MaoC family dehydratase [Promethearchaeota archaeon]|nr:MAG: MaoC family dehydratase [Candidatus Lokiarchaeota archaeon]